ncbi:tRNA (adenine(22)-N(1))-methyltransferase [Melghirimyces algeriensis]|uniref:tRNA (Adenine22-N1)-methyltransferase n=1 Tax=Melghirimyces algeriensis TaxID=910412 RepID=A0A521BSG5_9BACL|nr:class I SAM-dependent methyltransferase [Melghirimyces algeriensis]SMO50094.1 tRNA (adenine22-N1)-methyltransferase [Melghirimyces algeriensis]
MEREMKSSKISDRLSAVASCINAERVVADIGADHAQLLIYLAERGWLKKGIAGEVNRGPFQNAQKNVREAGLEYQIDVRLGDGLDVLNPGEAEVIVLAGMGGATITSILSQGNDKLSHVKQLILQPNNHGEQVRRWLYHQGWEIDQEELVNDGEILYEIISARPGNPDQPYKASPFEKEMMEKLGPLLCQKHHPLLPKKVMEEISSVDRILQGLQSARSPQGELRRKELQLQREKWEDVREWLLKEKI